MNAGALVLAFVAGFLACAVLTWFFNRPRRGLELPRERRGGES